MTDEEAVKEFINAFEIKHKDHFGPCFRWNRSSLYELVYSGIAYEREQTKVLIEALNHAVQTINYWEEFEDTSKMNSNLDFIRNVLSKYKGEIE